jgi:hypothetical protein
MMKHTKLAIMLIAVGLAPLAVQAQTLVAQTAEHRYQLDLHVNEAALAKFLPQGWAPDVATQGPAKDCNVRLIFIERLAVLGGDGKPLSPPTQRLAYLAVPIKQAATGVTGQMIIHGLTDAVADVPGMFGVNQLAKRANTARSQTASGGTVTGKESWSLAAATGEHFELHVEYEPAALLLRSNDTKFFSPADPSQYQVVKATQVLDIQRNTTTNPPDRVRHFSYKAGGGRIAALFDGSEKVLSWDYFPLVTTTVGTP